MQTKALPLTGYDTKSPVAKIIYPCTGPVLIMHYHHQDESFMKN